MKLNKRQKEALKVFKKNSLIIQSGRRQGKTTLLREIAKNHIGTVGILTPYYTLFTANYLDLPNCKYNDLSASLIIGDEVVYFSPLGTKSICAFTGDLNITKWFLDKKDSNYEEILKLKKEMTKQQFNNNFGNYIK